MKTKLALIACAALISACNTLSNEPDPAFGEAVKNNMAAQIVNPDAPVNKEPIDANGARIGLAQQRYQTGTTKPIESVTTTDIEGKSSE